MIITQYNDTTEYLLETKKEIFLRYFKEREKDLNKVMLITVRTPDTVSDELIINLECNIDKKIEYYEKAYDDDLKLINNPNIRIKAYAYGYMMGALPLMEIVEK